MFENSEIVNYVVCEKCFNKIIKPNQLYCKKCLAKTKRNKTSNKKLHNIRLNRNSSNLVKVFSVTKNNIGK
jgi:hypothetical protein